MALHEIASGQIGIEILQKAPILNNFYFIFVVIFPASLCVFFFQAEAGIRADLVTGVQTCALPIFLAPVVGGYAAAGCRVIATASAWRIANMQIGRASCRERVEMSVVGGA